MFANEMIKMTGVYIKIFLEWENWVRYSWTGSVLVDHCWSYFMGTWSSLHLIFYFGICLKFSIIKCFETICVDLDLVDPFLCPFFTWLGNGCGTGDPAAFWLPGRLRAWRWEWPSRKMVKGLQLWWHWWAPGFLHKNKLYFFKPLLVVVVIFCCCRWGYRSWYDVYAVNLTFSKKVLKKFKTME